MQTFIRPEILAPAGNFEMMKAAVENGADAVYFGVQAFNARLRADNFSLKELPETIAYLHQRGVKGYLTINTLVFSDELEQAIELLKACSNAGVDAIIVQDLGLAYLANLITPELPVHASTQMTLTTAESILGAENLGLKLERVVTARELSKKELQHFLKETKKEIEVFVHGAICVAYSGQCLTSEALGGRSANRGECAQACRLPYDLIVDGKKKEIDNIHYLLSPKDLAAYNDIADLIKIGIVSLKIEGRLKTPEYVAATVQTYRHAIDSFFKNQNKEFILDKKYLRRLENSFSRGFTPGYIHEVNHQQVVEGRFPTKRGTFLGEVIQITKHSIIARISAPIRVGDGVVFDSGNPESDIGGKIFYLLEKGKNIKDFNPDLGKIPVKNLELEFNFNPKKLQQIKVGNKIWKTKDDIIEAELKESYQGETIRFKNAISLEIFAKTNEELLLKARDLKNNTSIEVRDSQKLEKSIKHALTIDVLKEQLGRLGDTPFYLEELKAEIIDQPMIPLSKLNTLRRELVDKLLSSRRKIGLNRKVNNISLSKVKANITLPNPNKENIKSEYAELTVLCRKLEQVQAAVELKAKRIYTDFEDIRLHKEARKLINSPDCHFYPATLRIVKPQEAATVRKLFNCEADGILIRNLASWQIIKTEQPQLKLIADFSLNISNEITANLLYKNGFQLLTPSYDLNYDQLSSLLRNSNSEIFEITAHQYMPMFHMEHCVFCRFLSSGTDSSNCGRPCEKYAISLEDRKGFNHPVKADFNCRNTVFNGVAQSAASYIFGLKKQGVKKFRLDFLDETAEEVKEIYSIYTKALSVDSDSLEIWKNLKANTKLGVTNGSLDHEMISKEEHLYQIKRRKPAHSKREIMNFTNINASNP